MTVMEVARNVDTIVEAIDVRTGTVLTSMRVPGLAFPLRSGPYVWTMTTDAADRVSIVVHEVRFIQR